MTRTRDVFAVVIVFVVGALLARSVLATTGNYCEGSISNATKRLTCPTTPNCDGEDTQCSEYATGHWKKNDVEITEWEWDGAGSKWRATGATFKKNIAYYNMCFCKHTSGPNDGKPTGLGNGCCALTQFKAANGKKRFGTRGSCSTTGCEEGTCVITGGETTGQAECKELGSAVPMPDDEDDENSPFPTPGEYLPNPDYPGGGGGWWPYSGW